MALVHTECFEAIGNQQDFFAGWHGIGSEHATKDLGNLFIEAFEDVTAITTEHGYFLQHKVLGTSNGSSDFKLIH